MVTPVNRVTIHHEGAGSPSDYVDRFSEGGYCCGIGVNLWKRFRAPRDNWATLNYNHRDLTICLSGNRMIHQVTDNDLKLIHDAFTDFYNRGEVTSEPEVVAHRNSAGSQTVCPGDKTMDRWGAVAAQCRLKPIPPPPQPKPPEEDEVSGMANAKNHDGRPVVFQVGHDKKLYFRIKDPQGGNWGTWRDLSGGKTDFESVTAFVNELTQEIEVWATCKSGTFQRWQTDDKAGWEPWVDRTR
jgi:N-acetylmuramoyl-L-alanine amidase